MPPEAETLWALTSAAGNLAGRFIADEARHFPLAGLCTETTLAAPQQALAGACVLLRTATQLATALALLELDGAAARIVLCTPDFPSAHLAATAATAGVTHVVSEAPPVELVENPPAFVASNIDILHTRQTAPIPRRATEWVLFTSGTTGAPKMALHTLQTLTGAIPRGGGGGGSVWGTFYDIRRYGGLQILLRALIGGGGMLLSSPTEAPTDFLTRAAAAGIDFLSGTPTHWRRALLSPAAEQLALRDARLSGEIADQAILDKLRAAYPHARVRHAFASTEAGVAFDVTDGMAGFPAEWLDQTRDGVELRVTDGTLRVRSGRVAHRYLSDDAEPLADAEGFVDSKDLIEIRDGRAYFMGRRDGVINVGGLKVHPEEVEAVVNRHPDVLQCLVRSRRSPIIGAVVMVDVVRRGGAGDHAALQTEILAACRAALPPHKVPAAVRVVSALPVSAAGKLLRADG